METADEILKVASAAFDKRGLPGLSLRAIAKTVGITPMAIYRHYASKQALIDAVVLDALQEWEDIVARVPPAAPLEWIRNLSEAHVNFALEKPRRYEAAFLLHTTKARRYPDDFEAGRSPVGALQMRLIGELIDQGAFKATTPLEAFVTLAALSQGLITLHRAGRTAGGTREFRKFYASAMQRCFNSFTRKSP
ncbi:MAG TPA: TetR/AcrR family transcriptional regulator [Steroidobacteraceae bacterium]|jgi:AcrR family transcriptional regulator